LNIILFGTYTICLRIRKGKYKMTYKEKAVQLLDQIPESKMFYIIGILEGAAIPDETPNAETLAAFAEVDEMKRTGSGQKFQNLDDLWASLED
jgi:hypothetical protein